MRKEPERDSELFSAGKPKSLPRFYFPTVIALIAALIILYASLR